MQVWTDLIQVQQVHDVPKHHFRFELGSKSVRFPAQTQSPNEQNRPSPENIKYILVKTKLT